MVWLGPIHRSAGYSRQQFLDELMAALPVDPVTISVALRAGQVDGENSARGGRVAISDLLRM
jgi:predicted nucleic acid-binding protein